ncbi:hypothetical protein CK203_096597 [Vitis vinifera]|uniref:Uncharacterized protein n=1 Tax=Vitis vinifera TaxID=29760 RepID=A0A438DDJ3_VITVI|nr:hypothetical protein CK203_096597 [Vitis vinifera]
MRGRRNSQKARAMRGLGIMSRGVDSAWNRKDSRSRWRRGEVDCMPRLWKERWDLVVGQNRSDEPRIVFECLNLSIEDRRMGRWAREWKENGRMYSLSRDYNRGGCFLRLGVVDLEGKRFMSISLEEKGEKGGWASMADTLRSLGCEESDQSGEGKERAAARVDITTEEVGRNLSKLGHCIVGTWNHNAAKGDDLRGWGSQLTRIWRGGASFKDGKYFSWGVDLRLEKWNPETGCLKEGERSNEAWVRVVGLPVSMWDRDILRKIGDACGGFLAIDHQTEKMEDLQWARLLASHQSSGDWKEREDRRDRCEGRGDASARAGGRVLGAMEGSRLEDCLMSEDGTQSQSRPSEEPRRGHFQLLGKDDQWGLRCGDETEWGGSPAPIALCWRKTQGVFRPFWNFSGVNQGGLPMQRNWAFTQFAGKCWDLVEISNDSMEDDRKALCLARPISQEEGAWVDEGWEESELASSVNSWDFQQRA